MSEAASRAPPQGDPRRGARFDDHERKERRNRPGEGENDNEEEKSTGERSTAEREQDAEEWELTRSVEAATKNQKVS